MTRTTMNSSLWMGLIISLMLLGGCGEEPEETAVIPLPFTPPNLGGFSDPNWSPRKADSDPVVAKVGDAAIHLSELQRHVDAYDGSLPTQEVLDKLIEMELLAQTAYNQGYHHDTKVLMEIKEGAIREMLHHVFVESHSKDNILEADYEMAYNAFARKFEHFNAYMAGDAQFTCCYASDIDLCKKDADVQACFEAVEAVVEWTKEQLLTYPPFQTIDDFEFAMNTVAETLSADTPLVFDRIKFWYKNDQPYEEQTGFDKMNPNVVREIVRLLPEDYERFEKDPLGIHQIGPCQLGNPVRSNHGWHIPCLFGYLPERHDSLDDSGVREEIAEGIYPQIQRRDYQCFEVMLYPQDLPDIQRSLANCAELPLEKELLPTLKVQTSVNYDALDRLQTKLQARK